MTGRPVMGERHMYIRKSQETDLARMEEIYALARDFMKKNGNPRQWASNSWPPSDLLRKDIASGNSYVCVSDDGRVIGTFYFIFGPDIEPTYRKITEGEWKDDSPYGVIHRLAGDGSEKGIGAFCIDWAYDRCRHLRIDTHTDNKVMQALALRLGFVPCGTIYVVQDNDPRIAYEKSERVHA